MRRLLSQQEQVCLMVKIKCTEKLEGELVDRIACLEEGNSECAAKYGFISKTKWRREILDLVPNAQRFFL
jgi:hypothetical protein